MDAENIATKPKNGLSLRHRRSKSGMHLRELPEEKQSTMDYREEIERLRRASGLADVLPAEPPKKAPHKSIPAFEMPAHAARDSMLHSKSGFTNYRGLYNLALIMLVVSGLRIIYDNYSKYGLLVSPSQSAGMLLELLNVSVIVLLLFIHAVPIVTMFLEQALEQGYLPSKVGFVLHAILQLSTLFVPMGVILDQHPHPVASVVVMFQASVMWMKCFSYTSVNRHYRLKRATEQQDVEPPMSPALKRLVHYPENLNMRDVVYFMMAPTLCYELNFPRNDRIRWRFLVRRMAEVVLMLFFVTSFEQQWVQPTLTNTFKDSTHVPLSYLIDRTLKLSLPNNIIWLCLFYMFFHAGLNVLGELLRFADRQFYRDWWNSTTITYFWKNWNIPVHKWAVRHVYRPIVSAGYSKFTAQLAVFFISAVFHELLISVPLCMFRLWAFTAMAMQVPMAIITDKYLKGTQYGNVVVWASLFFGQPAAIMLYVQAYLAQNQLNLSEAG
eukprot:TRINITY_DN7729_c0_g1_i2.p1 TRINITY_DN7729_c0_g1~~TRINITY_DN7729_c0_g1_i2.p1  ORF type:complete len:513 (+),score=81.15 TRINITY_DN7729_c0_g1_i2:50-1540(+)